MFCLTGITIDMIKCVVIATSVHSTSSSILIWPSLNINVNTPSPPLTFMLIQIRLLQPIQGMWTFWFCRDVFWYNSDIINGKNMPLSGGIRRTFGQRNMHRGNKMILSEFPLSVWGGGGLWIHLTDALCYG